VGSLLIRHVNRDRHVTEVLPKSCGETYSRYGIHNTPDIESRDYGRISGEQGFVIDTCRDIAWKKVGEADYKSLGERNVQEQVH
jgi:hypothetical protein